MSLYIVNQVITDINFEGDFGNDSPQGGIFMDNMDNMDNMNNSLNTFNLKTLSEFSKELFLKNKLYYDWCISNGMKESNITYFKNANNENCGELYFYSVFSSSEEIYDTLKNSNGQEVMFTKGLSYTCKLIDNYKFRKLTS
jgi:hypothetical protein